MSAPARHTLATDEKQERSLRLLLAAALISGGLVALLVLVALTRFQRSAWVAASTTPITEDED